MRKKRSFFEKLTGAVRIDDFDDEAMDDEMLSEEEQVIPNSQPEEDSEDFFEESGQLSIDVINDEEEIIIRAMIAGVKPQDLDVDISRDVVSIIGTREESLDVREEDYFHRELYWGSFARKIILPEEVDVEEASAREKHGLLEIRLPKVDKNRKTKLSVKSG